MSQGCGVVAPTLLELSIGRNFSLRLYSGFLRQSVRKSKMEISNLEKKTKFGYSGEVLRDISTAIFDKTVFSHLVVSQISISFCCQLIFAKYVI